jgi:ATP diphosphatase
MTDKITRLLGLMAALRTPDTGCPWDLEQSFASIAPYTIEEAYEVADAIERGDLADLRDELGDLLLQVVFHARLAEEQDAFDFGCVVDAISDKLIRRHPHVFGETPSLSASDVAKQWNEIKAQEKERRAAHDAAGLVAGETPSLLEGVPLALPALTRAVKLQDKAGKVGFDWANARQVLSKIREETDEVEQELNETNVASAPSPALMEEIGDLLFVIANLARHLAVDPEQALRAANSKFERRFKFIEQRLEEKGKTPLQSSLEEMEELWIEAKEAERK